MLPASRVAVRGLGNAVGSDLIRHARVAMLLRFEEISCQIRLSAWVVRPSDPNCGARVRPLKFTVLPQHVFVMRGPGSGHLPQTPPPSNRIRTLPPDNSGGFFCWPYALQLQWWVTIVGSRFARERQRPQTYEPTPCPPVFLAEFR
jgi:hypothetical protein